MRPPYRFPHRLALCHAVALAAVLALTASAGASACLTARQNICVIDGDTLSMDGERIRIANIDAPEIGRPKCDAEKRLGLIAKRRLAALLSRGTIELTRGDPGSGRQIDRYGRTLGVIAVDGIDVGDTLVDELLARPWGGKRRNWCD